jgi:putative transposase
MGSDKLTPPFSDNVRMATYKRQQSPPSIISYAGRVYYGFNLSCRDVEDILAEPGITFSYESIRLWCTKFGRLYARRLKRNHRGFGDTFYLNEVFIKINGTQHYLWRAVDQDGEVVDVYPQERLDGAAAKRFLKRVLKPSGAKPRTLVTDKLASYRVALRELLPDCDHDTTQYSNNGAERSHQSTWFRERGMRRFKSARHAQNFLSIYSEVRNLFNLARHLIKANHYRNDRKAAFAAWAEVAI